MTRSASTESWIDSEKFRENQRNSDQVQGVHNVKKPTSFEGPSAEECQVGEKHFIFKKILRTELFEILRMQGVCGRSKSFLRIESQKG
jgi:hypothetical protein